ncbi:hypothetical protein PInf_016491 [Phytophthora infestans]|nr:hypothetical protein PInf_016491 [Phytophthora infestans]
MALVDALQLLLSHKFYEVFGDVREPINAFQAKWALGHSAPSNVEDVDESSSHEVNQLQPVVKEYQDDSVEVAQLFTENIELPRDPATASTPEACISILEPPLDDLEACYRENPSQVSLPDLDFSEQSQDVLRLAPTNTAAVSGHRLHIHLPVVKEYQDDSVEVAQLFTENIELPRDPATASTPEACISILEPPLDDLEACYRENPSQVSLPDLDFSEQSQDVLRLAPTNTAAVSGHRLHIHLVGIYVISRKLLQRVNSALVEYAKAPDRKKDYELVGDDPDDVVAAAYVVAELGGFSRISRGSNETKALLDN